MAITLRLTEKQEATLERIGNKLSISTKSKSIIWLIENIEQIETEKLNYHDRCISAESKLRELADIEKEQSILRNKIMDREKERNRIIDEVNQKPF